MSITSGFIASTQAYVMKETTGRKCRVWEKLPFAFCAKAESLKYHLFFQGEFSEPWYLLQISDGRRNCSTAGLCFSQSIERGNRYTYFWVFAHDIIY